MTIMTSGGLVGVSVHRDRRFRMTGAASGVMAQLPRSS